MESKMKALVTYGAHDYRLEEVDIPRAGKGEIVIKVEGCGICAGDLRDSVYLKNVLKTRN